MDGCCLCGGNACACACIRVCGPSTAVFVTSSHSNGWMERWMDGWIHQTGRGRERREVGGLMSHTHVLRVHSCRALIHPPHATTTSHIHTHMHEANALNGEERTTLTSLNSHVLKTGFWVLLSLAHRLLLALYVSAWLPCILPLSFPSSLPPCCLFFPFLSCWSVSASLSWRVCRMAVKSSGLILRGCSCDALPPSLRLSIYLCVCVCVYVCVCVCVCLAYSVHLPVDLPVYLP